MRVPKADGGCDALVTGNDHKLLSAVPEERTMLAHIGPLNWDVNREFVRFLYANEETNEHHIMVLATTCATKLAAALLMGLHPDAAAAAIKMFRQASAEKN